MKYTIRFAALPGCVMQLRIPNAQGKGIDYSVLRLGNDDVVPMVDGMAIEVDAESELEAVGAAFRALLRTTFSAVYDEFNAAHDRAMRDQQEQGEYVQL